MLGTALAAQVAGGIDVQERGRYGRIGSSGSVEMKRRSQIPLIQLAFVGDRSKFVHDKLYTFEVVV